MHVYRVIHSMGLERAHIYRCDKIQTSAFPNKVSRLPRPVSELDGCRDKQLRGANHWGINTFFIMLFCIKRLSDCWSSRFCWFLFQPTIQIHDVVCWHLLDKGGVPSDVWSHAVRQAPGWAELQTSFPWNIRQNQQRCSQLSLKNTLVTKAWNCRIQHIWNKLKTCYVTISWITS